ncbi:hypothetical protein JQX13_07105 [Archangium violaceum]|uniref:hypothetical protein n=1 Tax=Archangium violaceum TaxID=83451 RepID=UPI00193B7FE2|nr:hypothetical protein [Archangium violaceum]QRK09870.1 hypothetical protein JQX13_07105 [Archangium violaceum]
MSKTISKPSSLPVDSDKDPKPSGARPDGYSSLPDEASQPGGDENLSELLTYSFEELMSCVDALISGIEDETARGLDGAPSERGGAGDGKMD